ncbi:MAG TPA: hypothetical protein ACFYD1_05990 [Candidatus Hypogeohydataceae bacterium YC38]
MAKESPHSKKSNGKTPIRVLQVITRLIPGGAVEVALNLCSGLKERGFQVELAGATDPKTAETVRKMGIPFHPSRSSEEKSALYMIYGPFLDCSGLLRRAAIK